jgi:DNA mismatch repair ATPase MutS
MEIKLNLTNSEHKDLVSYCNLNDVLISEVVKKSFTTGFNIERYGLLNSNTPQEKIVEKEVEKIVEVIKEVPVEKIVEVVKEVVVEKPVEVIKEIPVEKVVVKEIVKEVPVEKIVTIYDKSDDSELLSKIQQLENGMSKKQEELNELRHSLDELLDKPPVEKIVEVVVEKEIPDNSLKPKLDALQTTLAKVRQETLEKDEKIKELENTIQELKKTQENRQAVYLKGSNLNNKL